MNRVAVHRFAFVCFLVVGAIVDVGCGGFAGVGDSCAAAPCATGLLCVDEHCVEPEAPVEPDCAVDDDCVIGGSADGYECVDGTCVAASCSSDAQCGTRVCIDGSCAERVLCLSDAGCDDGTLCIDNACRPPCLADDDCGAAIGGVNLQQCVEGRCLQRCLNDATCFGGGLCEDGVCVAEECSADDILDRCGDLEICDGGRCTAYTPCAADGDCFDPNLRCDVDVEPARCVERPACFNDGACGLDGLCLDNHCRPADGCFDDDDCTDVGDECVAGRCVPAPGCRVAADCAANQACANLRCVASDVVSPADLIVADDIGACDGICRRTYVVGETATFRALAVDTAGLPVQAAIEANVDNAAVIATAVGATVVIDAVDVALDGAVVAIEPLATEIAVTVVEAPAADELVVLVVYDNGAPLEAVVALDGTTQHAATTNGVARFATVNDDARGIVVSSVFGPTVIVADATTLRGHAWRMVVAGPRTTANNVATARVTVSSTGDELGPVGLGLALPALSAPTAVSAQALLGDDVAASLELPVIGALPVTVPAALSLSATLPLLGEQVVRDASDVVVVDGPSFVLALEGRRENDTLPGLALGGDLRAFAFELFEQSETLDALLVPLGTVTARARTSTGAPDFAGGLVTTASPSTSPLERGGVLARRDAVDVDDVIVVAGLDLPGRFVPTGVGRIAGTTTFEGVALPESFKSVPASAALSSSSRAVVVAGVFADPSLRSQLVWRGARLPTQADLGALLAPPEGAFVVDGLPAAGDRSVVVGTVGDADLVRLRFVANGAAAEVLAAASSTIRLPTALNGATLVGVDVLKAGGLGALQATGGARRLDDVATAIASAPAR